MPRVSRAALDLVERIDATIQRVHLRGERVRSINVTEQQKAVLWHLGDTYLGHPVRPSKTPAIYTSVGNRIIIPQALSHRTK